MATERRRSDSSSLGARVDTFLRCALYILMKPASPSAPDREKTFESRLTGLRPRYSATARGSPWATPRRRSATW